MKILIKVKSERRTENNYKKQGDLREFILANLYSKPNPMISL